MGSANYYLVAKFPQETAQAGKDWFEQFVDQGIAAYDYWQINRSKNPSNFWKQFEKKYPIIYSFLEETGGLNLEDCNNSLAGVLSYFDTYYNLDKDETTIYYNAEVWHFADWRPLISYLEKSFEAKADYESDEYVNIFTLLEERLVKNTT